MRIQWVRCLSRADFSGLFFGVFMTVENSQKGAENTVKWM